MNIKIDWKEFKYQIADFIFRKELDEAFDMGKKHGAEYATKKISGRLSMPSPKEELTKTQLIGYDKANQLVQACKYDIRVNTGANVYEVL